MCRKPPVLYAIKPIDIYMYTYKIRHLIQELIKLLAVNQADVTFAQ